MNLTLTEKQTKIATFIKDRHIPSGLGDETEACTIAAINLAIYGKLNDSCPPCICPIIHRFVIPIQDSLPDEMRNSQEYRNLVPLLAGTKNPDKEQLRKRNHITVDVEVFG